MNEYQKTEICPKCGGSGEEGGTYGPYVCTKCNGEGKIAVADKVAKELMKNCPKCGAEASWLVQRDGSCACNKCDSVIPRMPLIEGAFSKMYGDAYNAYLVKHGSGLHTYEDATGAGFEAIALHVRAESAKEIEELNKSLVIMVNINHARGAELKSANAEISRLKAELAEAHRMRDFYEKVGDELRAVLQEAEKALRPIILSHASLSSTSSQAQPKKD